MVVPVSMQVFPLGDIVILPAVTDHVTVPVRPFFSTAVRVIVAGVVPVDEPENTVELAVINKSLVLFITELI
jgi:hypothetical protein